MLILSLLSLFRSKGFPYLRVHFQSFQFSRLVMSDSLRPHGLQHARPPCPLPTPGVYSNSCPLSWWCHPTISSSYPFSYCLQSFPASGSFQMSQFFSSGGQSIGVSASTSVLPMNIQDWSPLGWTGWIYLQSILLQECIFSTFKTINVGLSTFHASVSLFLSLLIHCSIYKNSHVVTLPR